MAIREKPVTFAFPMTTTLVPDATVTNLDQITVYIPEANPTFTSVFAEVGFQDVITATGGTITEHRVALRLGAAGYTTITQTGDLTQTGENIGGVLSPYDFTAHFNTNWTGSSMTCDAQVYFDQSTGTTQGMANVTLLLRVTYQYDDTAETQIKTVALPLESCPTFPGAKATNTALGINGIPALTSGGVLPEAGVTIRDWFIIVEGNESAGNVTSDFTVSLKIDSGGTWIDAMPQERALASDRFGRWLFKPPTVPDTDVAHTVYVSSETTGRLHHPVATLYVTYEFTLSGTTRTLNSVLLPIEAGSPMGSPVAGNATRIVRDVIISDPGTITMRNSAVRVNWNANNGVGTIRIRVGSQAYRAYTDVATVTCGMLCLQQRIDAGSAEGAALTLARGKNSIVIDGYGSSANDMTNINGYILLTYESDVAPEGIGANTHSVFKAIRNFSGLSADLITMSGFSFPIPEADYWLAGAGFCMNVWDANFATAITLDAQFQSGEGLGAGYVDIYADALQKDSEVGCSMIWARGRDVFKRCPQDADSGRVDIEVSRLLRFFSGATARLGLVAVATYHGMTWSIAGNLTDGDAALPTVVKLHRADSGEVMQRQTLSAGVTSYSFTVYDDTEQYYVTAEQDAAHVGRSATGTAS